MSLIFDFSKKIKINKAFRSASSDEMVEEVILTRVHNIFRTLSKKLCCLTCAEEGFSFVKESGWPRVVPGLSATESCSSLPRSSNMMNIIFRDRKPEAEAGNGFSGLRLCEL